MGFRPCEHVDPFTRRIREVYRANVVRAPRSGINPLTVLAVRGRKVEPRGGLIWFVHGVATHDLPEITVEAVAGMNGTRSTRLDVRAGLEIAATFLAALGVPAPGAQLNLSLWEEARSIDFEVRGVEEHSIDVGRLGALVNGRKIVRQPASMVFVLDNSVDMLIITRTLTSRHFGVRAYSKAGESVAVTVDAITSLIGQVTGEVAWSREVDDTISFRGGREVTFAFAGVPCALQPDETFLFGLEASRLTYGDSVAATPEHQPIIDRDGLLILDAV